MSKRPRTRGQRQRQADRRVGAGAARAAGVDHQRADPVGLPGEGGLDEEHLQRAALGVGVADRHLVVPHWKARSRSEPGRPAMIGSIWASQSLQSIGCGLRRGRARCRRRRRWRPRRPRRRTRAAGEGERERERAGSAGGGRRRCSGHDHEPRRRCGPGSRRRDDPLSAAGLRRAQGAAQDLGEVVRTGTLELVVRAASGRRGRCASAGTARCDEVGALRAGRSGSPRPARGAAAPRRGPCFAFHRLTAPGMRCSPFSLVLRVGPVLPRVPVQRLAPGRAPAPRPAPRAASSGRTPRRRCAAASRVVVEASSSEPTIGPLLCQRKPATTQSAVRTCLTLVISRWSGP